MHSLRCGNFCRKPRSPLGLFTVHQRRHSTYFNTASNMESTQRTKRKKTQPTNNAEQCKTDTSNLFDVRNLLWRFVDVVSVFEHEPLVWPCPSPINSWVEAIELKLQPLSWWPWGPSSTTATGVYAILRIAGKASVQQLVNCWFRNVRLRAEGRAEWGVIFQPTGLESGTEHELKSF